MAVGVFFFFSVNCNAEFWSLSLDQLWGYMKTQGLMFFNWDSLVLDWDS